MVSDDIMAAKGEWEPYLNDILTCKYLNWHVNIHQMRQILITS